MSIFAALATLIIVDLIFNLAALQWPQLSLDPAVWGTYGDWASAILPTVAVLLTVGMWLRDRRERELQQSRALLRGLSLEVRVGDEIFVCNRSDDPVLLSASSNLHNSHFNPARLVTDSSIKLGDVAQQPEATVVLRDGSRWKLRLNHDPELMEEGHG